MNESSSEYSNGYTSSGSSSVDEDSKDGEGNFSYQECDVRYKKISQTNKKR